MYTLGEYNQALVTLKSDNGKHSRTLHLERVAGGSQLRVSERGGTPLLGITLTDDGKLEVGTWGEMDGKGGTWLPFLAYGEVEP